MKVQHWLDGGEDTPDNEYESVVCKACTRLHFINRKTGRLPGQADEQPDGGRPLRAAALLPPALYAGGP